MKTKNNAHFTILLSLLIFPLFAGCYQSAKKHEIPPPLVLVAQAEQREVQLYVDYTGKTDASEAVTVPARVQGVLEKMTFTPGQFVKKGEPLFVIEQTQYKANVQQAQAELDQAKAGLEFVQADYERTLELFNSSRAMTLEHLQDRTRNLAQAKAAVKSAEAALVQAELQLSYTEINAPIDGKISRNLIDVGNLVGGPSSVMTPLATINSFDPIYVYFEVSDSDLYRLVERYGNPAVQNAKSDSSKNEEGLSWPFMAQLVRQEDETFPANIGEHYPLQGIVNYISNTINPTMGSITVRGEIKNPDYSIFPGAVCHIKVPSRKLPDATVVYEKAIARDLNNHYMFVVDKDNKVERRIIEKGPAVDRETCVVLSGIKPGETYIVEGLQKVRIDHPVDAKPYEAAKPASAQ